jgi:hypothetical protein
MPSCSRGSWVAAEHRLQRLERVEHRAVGGRLHARGCLVARLTALAVVADLAQRLLERWPCRRSGCSRRLDIALRISASTTAGMPASGATLPGAAAVANLCCIATWVGRPKKGTRPVSSVYMSTPTE